MRFLELTKKPKVVYTDNSLEFGKSCEESYWNHCTSTAHRSEKMGLQEEQCVESEKGTSAMPLQSGLDNEWWSDSMVSLLSAKHSRPVV